MLRAEVRRWVGASLVLLIGGGIAYGILVGKPGPEAVEPPPARRPLVDVVTANPRVQQLIVRTQGTVRPRREISLVSRVSGQVQQVADEFAAGGFFTNEQELVKIEDADYQFALARAESQVAAAQQRVAEEKGRALQASREWRDLGSDEANALFLRKPQLASAEAALKAARADLGSARLNLDRTSIRVPFNGRISTKQVDIGQYVTPGSVIARVYDTDVVEIPLPLNDRQVALLDLPLNYSGTVEASGRGQWEAAPVTIGARFAGRQWQWQGRIVRTEASIDINSRMVFAVAEVKEPFAVDPVSGRPPLSIGLFVDVAITGRAIDSLATLPRSALRSDGTIMLVGRDQRLVQRQVNVLDSDAHQVWVQGLQPGEEVVVRETVLSVEGMAVTANNVTQIAAEAP